MTDPNVCLIFGVYSKYFDGKMYKAGTRGVLVALSLPVRKIGQNTASVRVTVN